MEIKIFTKKWWNEIPSEKEHHIGFSIMLFSGIGSLTIMLIILGYAVHNTLVNIP